MEFIVKENAAFRLRVKKNPCLRPEGLNNLEFVQECLNDKGEIAHSSTYQFFMTEEQIRSLCQGLVK
jgi:hypothetical protein